MSADVVSPLPGMTVSGYNLRVVPFGAVRGVADVSQPVTILENTKPVAYIAPLENPGLVSVPLAFFLGWLGTVTSKEVTSAAKYAEMEVRSLTGAGAEKAIAH